MTFGFTSQISYRIITYNFPYTRQEGEEGERREGEKREREGETMLQVSETLEFPTQIC